MVELSDEHGGHAIDGRAPFLVDGGEYEQGVKLLNHHLCAAVRQAVHGGQHHAEAME